MKSSNLLLLLLLLSAIFATAIALMLAASSSSSSPSSLSNHLPPIIAHNYSKQAIILLVCFAVSYEMLYNISRDLHTLHYRHYGDEPPSLSLSMKYLSLLVYFWVSSIRDSCFHSESHSRRPPNQLELLPKNSTTLLFPGKQV